jgi:flagellin
MSLRILHNVAALNAERNMVQNDFNLSKSLQKLSSGLKINVAADNPAGLVISEQMRAEIAGENQAITNSEQAVTMVQTAEGALDQMNTLLAKVKSLAIHALNTGVTDLNQRQADNAEMQNILSSIDRIAKTTRFANGVLLSGRFSGVANAARFQVGEQAGDNVTLTIGAMTVKALALSGARRITLSAATNSAAVAVATSALTQVSAAINSVTNLRGKLGAFQSNTLESGLSSLRITTENLTAAESVIRDVDFAEESANFTKNSILVQSSAAMLAQANQLPQAVLKLLGQ